MLNQEELEQEFDLEDEEINEALKQEEESAEEDKQDAHESEAKESGPKHLTKEEWIEQGRDPSKWRSEEVFKEVTQRIKETGRLNQKLQQERLAREADARRLTNIAFSQQQTINRLREEAERKKTDAIQIGDDKAVREIDKQLKDLDTEESLIAEPKQETQQIVIPPAVIEWNARNQWLTADHPLKPIANDIYLQAIEEGETVKAALKLVDAELAKHKESPSQKKTPTKSMVDSPRGAVPRGESVTLRFEDCTREEKDMYNEFYKSVGATMKDFLKDVSIARKGN